jgi:Iap family predicted aminopeptidase
MVLTGFERKALAEVSKGKCWEHVEWFAGVGEKLSGTPANERTVDYVLDRLKGYGVKASAPAFQAWLDFPDPSEAELRVLSPEIQVVRAMPLAQAAPTPPEGVEGELVYVGGGGLLDYEGVDARGKVVLAEFSRPPARPWKNYVAGILKGAVGMIVIGYTGPTRVYNRGTVKSVWGNPTPDDIDEIGRIPALLVSAEDGQRLKGLLRKEAVRVRMKAGSRRGWAATRQPMATISGREPGFVLLGSHLDAWRGAASCNAVGCASTLESARVLSRLQSSLRRGVELLWFQGHETGIMTGSTWYVDNHWDRLHTGCVAYLNNDTPSMIGTTVYSAEADPVLQQFVWSTVAELAEEEGAPIREPPTKYLPNKTGDQSFYGVGVPSVRVITVHPPEERVPAGGWWYHSDQDTLDKCDPDTLHMANKAQILVILRLCTLPVLPYKVQATADWTLDTLKQLRASAGGALDLTGLVGKAEVFKDAASSLDGATALLSERCRDSKEAERLEKEVRLTNESLLRICRVLNPVNYTLHGKYGQDHYGAEYIKPIPLLQPVSELVALDPDTSEYKALKTKLVRARNTVSDALEEVTRVARFTSDKLG